MGALFKTLGALVCGYVLYSLMTGAVYAKRRAWGRTFLRAEDAAGYWSALAAYVALAGMLLLLF